MKLPPHLFLLSRQTSLQSFAFCWPSKSRIVTLFFLLFIILLLFLILFIIIIFVFEFFVVVVFRLPRQIKLRASHHVRLKHRWRRRIKLKANPTNRQCDTNRHTEACYLCRRN